MARLFWLHRMQRLASSQHGIVTRAQLLHAGAPINTVDRMLRKGDLERLLPAVYQVHAGDEWNQLVAAALAWGGPEAVASYLTAGEIHGLEGIADSRVEITVSRKIRSPDPRVAVHVSEVPRGDRRRIDGFPVTAIERTLIDLASRLTPTQLERALDEALRRGLTKLERVATRLHELGSAGRAGAGTLRSLLEARDPRQAPTESQLEQRLAELIVRAGLPDPVLQYRVSIGNRRFRIDLAYPETLLALEVDGYAFHSGRLRRQRDLERQNLLINAGWRILRFTWADIIDRPERTIATIAAALSDPRSSSSGGASW